MRGGEKWTEVGGRNHPRGGNQLVCFFPGKETNGSVSSPQGKIWTEEETDCYTGWQHSFLEIDHEIFSTVILSLPLIQEEQLSVSDERMCTILVNHLED